MPNFNRQDALLERETVMLFCPVARLRDELALANNATNNMKLRDLIEALSKDAMIKMQRAVLKTSRSEYHDVKFNQREFQVLGAPIDTSVAPVLVYNSDQPRVWTDANDVVDADYVNYAEPRASEGIMLVEYSLSQGEGVLKITYTGGMATFAGLHGVDGATTAGAATLTSAGATFLTDGVVAGYKVQIIGGTNGGTYTVATAGVTETVLTMTGNFPASGTGQEFKVMDANSNSLIKDYPDLMKAVLSQAAFQWRRQFNHGVQSESMGGASVSFDGPVSWLPTNIDILRQYARGAM
jgi:hypothetical protein